MPSKTAIKRAIVRRLLGRDLPMSLVSPGYRLPAHVRTVEDLVSRLGCVPCNVNLDDLCPMRADEDGMDCGGDIRGLLAAEIRKLLADYPHIAVTFFVIPNLRPSGRMSSSPPRPAERLSIASAANAEWRGYYHKLASEYNIEYAMHGWRHWQRENPFFSRRTEFAFKREGQAARAVEEGLATCRAAGFDVRGFRQPGWDINSDMSLLGVLRRKGFSYIAGSSLDAGLNAARRRVSSDYPSVVDGLINFPQNVLLDWDVTAIKSEIDRLVAAGGMISIKGHFTTTRMTNSLTPGNLAKLRVALDHLTSRHARRVGHFTMADLASALGAPPNGQN
ncbi:MAG TPA: DUF2334 domain-containing protein [Phycisphaerae bacterium]|nr:DUF2334 domain-containing protein [Phycisphaerae bacterium]HUT59454.1 DUF2334 domain-containing protein [Phycisphaerae bacterium]